jgi:oxygen-independent coproporphyrinogen-3 oxidase
VAEATKAIEMAQAIFKRNSFDLIYARKGQSLQQWEAELHHAIKLAASHLSLYQLTIEPGTVFAQKTAIGERFTAQDDVADEMYSLTQDICAAAGLPAYEVSNHARSGEESRHNLSYWHYDEYIGIGAGAHGRVNILDKHGDRHSASLCERSHAASEQKIATSSLRPPEMWMNAVEAKETGLEAQEALSKNDQKTEHLMMNMRLFAGIDKAAWQQRYQEPLDAFLNVANKDFYIAENLLFEDAQTLRATRDGMMKLSSLTAKLLD